MIACWPRRSTNPRMAAVVVVARWWTMITHLLVFMICLLVLCTAFISDVRQMKPDVDASAVWMPTSDDIRMIFDGNGTSEGPCAAHYCQSRTPTTKSTQHCRCDSDCWKRRDCCLNAWTTVKVDDRAKIVQELMDDDHLKCESIVTRHKPTGVKVTSLFAMITRCRPTLRHNGRDNNHVVRLDKCDNRNDFRVQQDPLAFVPVTSHVTNVTYRNIFCAVCNQDYENVSLWKVDLSCRNHVSIRNASDALKQYLSSSSSADSGRSRSKCNLQMNPVSSSGENDPLPVAECLTLPVPPPSANAPPMVSECETHASSRLISWLCRTIYAPVNYLSVRNGIKVSTSFRNIYCVMCNYNDHDEEEAAAAAAAAAAIECHETVSSYMFRCPPFCPPVGSIRTRSFALLMDVDMRRGGLVVGTSERCPVGHIYDVFHEQCRTIFCCDVTAVKESNGTTTTITQIKHVDCLKIRYSAEEFDLDANGTTLTMRRTGRKYDQDEYEWELQGGSTSTSAVLICTTTTTEAVDLRKYNYVAKFDDAAFEYLTIGGLILSIVSLFLKMTIFAAVPESRNFPDRIVFCLSLSLFIAQLLFVAITDHVIPKNDDQYWWRWRCVVTAVLMHYFFLTSFTWMNVLAFDVWRTFATSTSRAAVTSTSKRKTFLRYSAYAWSSPLVIVSVAVALDHSPILQEDSPYRPYYGVAICWISGRWALLALFVVPIGLLIGTNAIFFSLTAWNIRCTSRQASVAHRSKMMSSSRSRCRTQERQLIRLFSLYVKLGTVMGLTWILGFVSIYARIALLWYAFTLLNTLQGVYILLAFTPFRKIRRAWLRLRHSSQIKCCSRRSTIDNINNQLMYHGRNGGNGGHLPLQRSSTNSSQVTRTSSLQGQQQQQHQSHI